MTNTEKLTIRKNSFGVSENAIVRDLEYVRAVGKRVIELLRNGHGLYKVRDGKAPINTLISVELGICRQSVAMSLRCLDLVNVKDRRFISKRAEFKKDLTKYGVGVAGDTVGVTALHASGAFAALRDKYAISATTLGCWSAAICYARDLVDIKRELAEIAEADLIDGIMPFSESLAVHINAPAHEMLKKINSRKKDTTMGKKIKDSKNKASKSASGVAEGAKSSGDLSHDYADLVRPEAEREAEATVLKEVMHNAPNEVQVGVKQKRKYVRKSKSHAIIGVPVPSSNDPEILNVSVRVTRKASIATLNVNSVDANGVNTSIVIRDAAKSFEGIDQAKLVLAICNVVRQHQQFK